MIYNRNAINVERKKKTVMNLERLIVFNHPSDVIARSFIL